MAEKYDKKTPPKGGKIVYTKRQSKAMTTEADSVTLTVPKGKRWLVYWGEILNRSGATIQLAIEVYDVDAGWLGDLIKSTVADNSNLFFPAKEGTQDLTKFGHGAYPLLLVAEQYISLSWSADAGKSGTSYWYIMIIEFSP